MNRITTMALVLGVFAMMGVMKTALWPRQDKSVGEEVAFQVAGLHCSACAVAVENALAKTAGVKKTRVDLKDKIARVTYDKNKTTIQDVARSIDATPSPMPNSKFESALILQVDKLRNEADVHAVEKALSQVKGVSDVGMYEEVGKTLVKFNNAGNATLTQLSEAVSAAGFKATAWTPQKTNNSRSLEHESGDRHDNHSKHGGHAGGCCGM